MADDPDSEDVRQLADDIIGLLELNRVSVALDALIDAVAWVMAKCPADQRDRVWKLFCARVLVAVPEKDRSFEDHPDDQPQ